MNIRSKCIILIFINCVSAVFQDYLCPGCPLSCMIWDLINFVGFVSRFCADFQLVCVFLLFDCPSSFIPFLTVQCLTRVPLPRIYLKREEHFLGKFFGMWVDIFSSFWNVSYFFLFRFSKRICCYPIFNRIFFIFIVPS